MTPDLVNGLFEFTGSIALWANVYRLHRDKQTRGVTWYATGFFASWSIWNCWFYPNYELWFSFWGGVSIVIANTVWLIQMVWYTRKEFYESES